MQESIAEKMKRHILAITNIKIQWIRRMLKKRNGYFKYENKNIGNIGNKGLSSSNRNSFSKQEIELNKLREIFYM